VNLRERCTLSVYGWVMWALQPLLRLKLARRARVEPGYANGVEQRFGHSLPARPQMAADQPLVWLHAVSLGETRAAAVLLRALRDVLPGMRLILTHSTATGLAEGAGLLQEGDVQSWLPWDTPGAVSRFLSHFRPNVGVLMETEVWPQLIQECHLQGIPMALVNARMNESSFAKALRWRALSRPAYAGLAQVCAQTETDALRLRQLGASAREAWGNLKFDAAPSREHLALAARWREASAGGLPFTIMLASSREGEEVQFLKEIRILSLDGIGSVAANFVCAELPPIRWLLVPRHPQRFNEVARLVSTEGFECSRRSTWGDTGPPNVRPEAGGHVVLLGDSLGEMALYYGMADVALLGGSFAPLGGQNLIEAAACACPLVLGPHTHNFADAAEQALNSGAAVRAADMAEGLRAAVAWLRSPHERQRASDAGVAFAHAHKGAADRMAAAVARWVSAPPAR
jgi:3-deoxy-D-manno-octulosonic-acid transferase